MAAAIDSFSTMTEAELRHWVEENPGSVNATDNDGFTPLCMTSCLSRPLALLIWLIDEKGADVNAPCSGKSLFPLHVAGNAAILTALLDRGANPTSGGDEGVLPLMVHAIDGKLDCIHRLLQEPRVLANIDAQVVGNFLDGEGRLIE